MYWDAHTQTYMTPNRNLCVKRGRWTQPDPFFHALHGNMQSSPAAIAQSANLFMFVMHNPVRFTDPTGLFAMPISTMQRSVYHAMRTAMSLAPSATTNRFDSPTEAAIAFAERYNPISFAERREIGAAIFRVDVFDTRTVRILGIPITLTGDTIIDSFYTFGTRIGGIGGVTRGPVMSVNNNFQGSISTSRPARAPRHTTHTEVAQVHTHGPFINIGFFDNRGRFANPVTDLGFSESDFNAARRRGVDTFMVDHRGYLHFASFATNFADAGVIMTGLPACPIWLEGTGMRDIRDMEYFRRTGRTRNLPAWP